MVYINGMFSVRLHSKLDKINSGLTAIIEGFPDPFAVATISGEQTRTTSVIKKTLNPYWNESFDMYVDLEVQFGKAEADTQKASLGREHSGDPDFRSKEVQEEGPGISGRDQCADRISHGFGRGRGW